MSTWILLTGLPLAALFALVMSPWGAPALALLASSRVARLAAFAAAAAWALFVALGRARKVGRDEALAEVNRRNAEAKAERARIDRDVASRSEAEVTRRLDRWSR
ncbi:MULTISPECIES: hypothetical protein [Methylobacterium]|uniref:hypothetical protein n=1 Tax=Methylobacterium TaxID=407 RepID=UPI00272E1C31|nr:hypothetical protein [Methylobacterium sp.]